MIRSIQFFVVCCVIGVFSIPSWGNQDGNKRETFKWEDDPLRPNEPNPSVSKGPGKFRQKAARHVGKGVGLAAGVGAGIARGTKETVKTAVDLPLQIGKERVEKTRQNPRKILTVPKDVAAVGMGVGIGAPIVGAAKGYMKGKETSKSVSRKVENKMLGRKNSQKVDIRKFQE